MGSQAKITKRAERAKIAETRITSAKRPLEPAKSSAKPIKPSLEPDKSSIKPANSIKTAKNPATPSKRSSLPPKTPSKAPLEKDLAHSKVRPQTASKARKTAFPRKKPIPHLSKSAQIERSILTTSEYSLEQERRAHKTSTWQNPLVAYFNRRYPRFRLKHPQPSQQKRTEHRILLMLAFFSISIGLWENFRQLWLQNNDFPAADVSTIISIGTIIGAIGSLLVGKFVKMSKLKSFMTVILIVRCVNFLILASLNGLGATVLIDIFSIIDVVTGMLFLVSIYPLITIVSKSAATFSRRKLVEYLFRDVGILIGGVFIGQQLGSWVVGYNTCLIIATGFAIAAAWTMMRLKFRSTEKAPEEHFSALRYIMHSRLQRTYMIYTFLAGTAFNTAMGLKMLILTDSFGFSAGIATNYLLVAGLIADFLGILALRFFTPKNDYVSLTIKFGLRFVTYIIAAFSNNYFVCFVALTWTILSSTAYEDVTDGQYINLVDNRHQLKYNTIRFVIHHLGVALGTFLCGQMFDFGPGAILGLASFILLFQLFVAFYLVYIHHCRRKTTTPVQKAR